MKTYPLPPAVEPTATFLSERAGAAAFARAHGYFWLPCPLCGIHFGGHEIRRGGGFEDYPHHIPDPARPPVGDKHGWQMGYQGICPFCTKAKRGWDWPPSAYPEI